MARPSEPSSERKRILITAAAGGCGVWHIQLAKIAGLEVIAQIGSPQNDGFIRGLGATETVNYRTISLMEWAKTLEPVDLVIDCIGGGNLGGGLVLYQGPRELDQHRGTTRREEAGRAENEGREERVLHHVPERPAIGRNLEAD